MTDEWLIIWNKKYYNYNKLFSDINKNIHNTFIYQQYRYNQKIFPKLNNIIYIKSNGYIIAKSILICAQLEYTNNISDKYDITNSNSQYNKYCVIQIINIYKIPLYTKYYKNVRTNWSIIENNKDFD